MGNTTSYPSVRLPPPILSLLMREVPLHYAAGGRLPGHDSIATAIAALEGTWPTTGASGLAALHDKLCSNKLNKWPTVLNTRAARLAASLLVWEWSGDDGVRNALTGTTELFSMRVVGSSILRRFDPPEHLPAISVLQLAVLSILLGIPVGPTSPLKPLASSIGMYSQNTGGVWATNGPLPNHLQFLGVGSQYELLGALVLLRNFNALEEYNTLIASMDEPLCQKMKDGVAAIERFNSSDWDISPHNHPRSRSLPVSGLRKRSDRSSNSGVVHTIVSPDVAASGAFSPDVTGACRAEMVSPLAVQCKSLMSPMC